MEFQENLAGNPGKAIARTCSRSVCPLLRALPVAGLHLLFQWLLDPDNIRRVSNSVLPIIQAEEEEEEEEEEEDPDPNPPLHRKLEVAEAEAVVEEEAEAAAEAEAEAVVAAGEAVANPNRSQLKEV